MVILGPNQQKNIAQQKLNELQIMKTSSQNWKEAGNHN